MSIGNQPKIDSWAIPQQVIFRKSWELERSCWKMGKAHAVPPRIMHAKKFMILFRIGHFCAFYSGRLHSWVIPFLLIVGVLASCQHVIHSANHWLCTGYGSKSHLTQTWLNTHSWRRFEYKCPLTAASTPRVTLLRPSPATSITNNFMTFNEIGSDNSTDLRIHENGTLSLSWYSMNLHSQTVGIACYRNANSA